MAVLGINSSNKGTALNGNDRQYLSNAFYVSGIMLNTWQWDRLTSSSHYEIDIFISFVCVDEELEAQRFVYRMEYQVRR